jgi:predicted nucleic acid-binding protein
MRSERLATTAITVFEIWKGLETDSDRELARRSFRGVRVYPLSDAAARRAAELARLLRQNPIGDRDTLIAGVCLAIQRPLLTSNVRHFRRVPGLEVLAAR